MLNPYFKSSDKNFYLLKGNSFDVLPQFEHKFDMVFADPPYFLSNNGLSIQSGKIVSVNKGKWDKSEGFQYVNDFNRKWLTLVRDKMKDDATIWISGTMHNIFSVGQILTELDFKILNVITWEKSNPPPNFSCRFFTHSAEQIIWARKNEKIPHYFNYALMKQLNGDKQMKDVWKLPAIAPWEKSFGKHPTQKPLSVLTRIILASTKPESWILDPFTGSSTTGIAANLANRRFLGIDQDESFLELSKKRKLEIENTRIAALYKQKINGFNTKQEYTLFLATEPNINQNVVLGFCRSSELYKIKNKTMFYFHAEEENNKIRSFPEGILDSEFLFLYSGGRSKKPRFNGYFSKIKSVKLKHKSKIKGKQNSITKYYYEVELETKFRLNRKLNTEIDRKLFFGSSNNKESKNFVEYLPAVTTLIKVLELNNLDSLH